MKTAFLQLTDNYLLLTPVNRAGRQNVFRAPLMFDLPQNLRGRGQALAQPHALAVFTVNCMRGTVAWGSSLIIVLDSNTAVTKEYRHLPANKNALHKFARLESETILQDSPDGYYIATSEYHRTELSSGRLKSILFAVPKALVIALTQEFRKVGVKVIRISPALGGLINSCRTMLGLTAKNPVWKGKTVALVDAGCKNLRVAIFTGGTLVYQREFDSVWPDILDTLRSQGGCSCEEAVQEMRKPGFLLSGGNAAFGESVTSLVNALLETASAEVVRNMRVVFSAERLEMDRVIFCGSLASHPDFPKYLSTLSLDVPFENVETAAKRYRTFVEAAPQSAAEGARPGDFFTLNGLMPKYSAIDFLAMDRNRRSGQRANAFTLGIIGLAALAVMAIEPLLYQQALMQRNADSAALSASRIVEMEKLQEKKNRLTDELQTIEQDRKLLPTQKSRMEEVVTKLQTQLVPRVTAVTSCQMSGDTGNVTLAFTTTSFEQFNNARKSLTESGYFDVLAPFSATKGNGSSGSVYQCSVTLRIRNFRPLSSGSAQPAASSSQGGR